jgi:hypothetical protein
MVVGGVDSWLVGDGGVLLALLGALRVDEEHTHIRTLQDSVGARHERRRL